MERNRARAKQRKIRALKRFIRRALMVIVPAGLMIAIVLLCRGCAKTSEQSEPQPQGVIVEAISQAALDHDIPDTENLDSPFSLMSIDWSADDLRGWWHYDIPNQYEKIGGYLPDLVQVYTYCLCKQSGIRYELVLALIENASGYRYDSVSSSGEVGYMQVSYKWQKEKMSGLKEKALRNPYTNIRVGIEYLQELSELFDTEAGILTAYKYGPGGAMSRCFNDREITSEFADTVLENANRIEQELLAREEEAHEQSGE